MLTGLAAIACSAGPAQVTDGRPSPQADYVPVSAGAATSWPAYHADATRSGYVHGLPAAGQLALGWARRLDGAVYGQPLVVRGIVIAATENDTVYGLNRSTGRVLWARHLGSPLPLSAQPCGNINPLGITSTPVYDPATGLVYALAQVGTTEHLLAGLDPVTGRVRYRMRVPSPDGHPAADQQRGALAAGNGRIYVVFGGHFGDCGPYVGSVVGLPATGRGRVVSYLAARVRGGIWSPAGPVIAANGTVFVGVGNGAMSRPYDGSDSAVALGPGLRRIGLFAPRSWAADNASDLDLGAMTPELVAGQWLLAVGKSGLGYLLRPGHLGGVGGQVATARVCAAFGGAAVLPETAGPVVIVPCEGGGPVAVAIRNGGLHILWRGPAGADGSPVAGGGAIWVTDNAAGTLFELSPATGRVRHQISLGGALPHFASPSLTGRLVLIGTMHGVVAVTGA
jgi:polyvinyl alcohol dehydrogenase (cytochrome)